MVIKESDLPSLKLKQGNKARVLRGHPWVFSTEVQKLLPTSLDGKVVECRDARGYLLGSGFYNSRSKIIWRRLFREKGELNFSELKARILRAIERRKDENVRRLVWSESDDLPGLVIDQYENKLVVQTLTLGMDLLLEDIVSILVEHFKPECVVVRNDVPTRKLEGLEEKVFVARGEEPKPLWCKIGDVEFYVDVLRGHKTGFYLDQREQYGKVAVLARGRKVFDAFCNQGGFALHCAKAGAKEVLGMDSSEEAVDQARKNAERNLLQARFEVGNIFDYFTHKKNESWDMVILDPPPFARSKEKLEDACRGYKELNLRAMKSLTSGGILATYCCSHHVSQQLFSEILADAAGDAKRDARVVEICSHPQDHPMLLNVPESEYLKGLILEVR